MQIWLGYPQIFLGCCRRAFGWLTPINKDYSFADWVAEHNMPTIVGGELKKAVLIMPY